MLNMRVLECQNKVCVNFFINVNLLLLINTQQAGLIVQNAMLLFALQADQQLAEGTETVVS
jgi:hypothetical protein